MKIKKSEHYFYELLLDFLYKYLVVQRKFTDATVKNYTDSMNHRVFLSFPKHPVNQNVCYSSPIIQTLKKPADP